MWSFLVFLIALLCRATAVPYPQNFLDNSNAGTDVSQWGGSQLLALGGSGTDMPVENTNTKSNTETTDLKPAAIDLNFPPVLASASPDAGFPDSSVPTPPDANFPDLYVLIRRSSAPD